MPRITCQKLSQVYHTISRRSLNCAHKSSRMGYRPPYVWASYRGLNSLVPKTLDHEHLWRNCLVIHNWKRLAVVHHRLKKHHGHPSEGYTRGNNNSWPWEPMKKLLKSLSRFWYREIRDFINSKHTVPQCTVRTSTGRTRSKQEQRSYREGGLDPSKRPFD
jgi:hypothetical protein